MSWMQQYFSINEPVKIPQVKLSDLKTENTEKKQQMLNERDELLSKLNDKLVYILSKYSRECD
jgi:hypothetical protein